MGVVVPARDAARWLEAALGSLLAQTHSRWVCVVVDDGSRDDTRHIAVEHALRDARILVVPGPEHGVAAARNTGLRALPADVCFVHFLDSDDLLLPGALARLLAALDRRPDAVSVWGLAEYVDEQGRVLRAGSHPRRQQDRRSVEGWRVRRLELSADSTYADLVLHNPVWPAAVGLHRRSALTATGGFTEQLRQLEDWDLYLRLSRLGPLVPLSGVVALYRRHDDNLTRSALENDVSRELLMVNAFKRTSDSTAHRRLVVAGARRRRVADARVALRTALRAARQRDGAASVRAVVAAGWNAASVFRARPPAPSPRRAAWTRALTHHSSWQA